MFPHHCHDASLDPGDGRGAAAAAIHGHSLKSYMILVLEAHLELLEERGMVLRVEETGKTKKSKGK